uniref:Uncharacterized immunity region protein 11 n=1 Tax=Bacillus phage phi105 TaxID=10717 RepID=YIMB_BPPH1|nr:RecName: Full=Uncharacterized immunity region protein 11 [Bacillus phage phi105]AAA88398.1 unknown protein [Bacillus phage phi105]prf//1112178C ORF 11 [Bacillus phage phi105]
MQYAFSFSFWADIEYPSFACSSVETLTYIPTFFGVFSSIKFMIIYPPFLETYVLFSG